MRIWVICLCFTFSHLQTTLEAGSVYFPIGPIFKPLRPSFGLINGALFKIKTIYIERERESDTRSLASEVHTTRHKLFIPIRIEGRVHLKFQSSCFQ